jgi:hypothetical protein
MNIIEFEGKIYDARHGGAFDRGGADSYYLRGITPHYYMGDTGNSLLIEENCMTDEEKQEYYAGFRYNTESGDFKEYG